MDSKTKQRTVGSLVIAAVLVVFLPLLWHAMIKQPKMAPVVMEFPPPPDRPYVDSQQIDTAKLASVKTTAKSKTIVKRKTNNITDANSPYQVVSREALQKAAQTTDPHFNTTTTDDNNALYKGLAATIDSRQYDEPRPATTKSSSSANSSFTPPAQNTTVSATKIPVKKVMTQSTQSAVSKDPSKVNTASKMTRTKVSSKTNVGKYIHAWTIQIASFSDKQHAINFRDQLKQKGFHAYINNVDTTKGKHIRVYVGPELSRYKAQIQLAKIDRELHAKGMIVRYDAT